jgi:hypothetical protein
MVSDCEDQALVMCGWMYDLDEGEDWINQPKAKVAKKDKQPSWFLIEILRLKFKHHGYKLHMSFCLIF